MFVSIRVKIFALLMLAMGMMVAVILITNAVTFKYTFSEYIEQQEQRRLSSLVDNLGKVFAQKGDWNWLTNEPQLTMEVLRKSLSEFDRKFYDRQNGQRQFQPKALRGEILEHLKIKNTDGTIILGRSESRFKDGKIVWLPITQASNSKVVGYLGFNAENRSESQFDNIFLDRLKLQYAVIGLLALSISAGLAIPFSGWLVKPIQRLKIAMQWMSDGDYTVKVNSDRKDELGQLAENFNQLSVVLQKNHEDRQQWVSDIAHELRTPVAVLQGDIEAAQDGVRKVDDQWLQSMYAHSERLTRLVNDLHQLSQSDAGALTYRFESLDIVALTDEVVAQFKSSFNTKHIEVQWVRLETPLIVRADDKRLVQLMTNLAQNTLRYTDGTAQCLGLLKINLKHDADKITLVWEDSSPGVELQDLPKLFDRLYRVDESRSRESGGSGLGLAIVKNIALAHQAEVSAQQSEQGGLKITVVFNRLKEK